MLHQQMTHSQFKYFGLESYKYSLGEITTADEDRLAMEDAEHSSMQENIEGNTTITMTGCILTN
jgi:hypothetical protein